MANQIATSAFSHFGSGAIKCLAEALKINEYQRVLVITDTSTVKDGAAKKVVNILVKNRVVYQVYDRINTACTVNDVRHIVEMAKAFRADVIVGVGSGAVMDASKAAAVLLSNPEISDPRKLEGSNKAKKHSFPLYLVFASCGNARGFGFVILLEDEAQRRKIECLEYHAVADAVICDSDIFTGSASKDFAVSSMALIASAIEALVCKESWVISDFNALEAIRIISQNVKSAVKGTASAKEQIIYGQYLAGLAVSNSGAGLATAMSNALEATHGVSAKISSVALMPFVMAFNSPSSGSKFKDVAIALGAKVSTTAKPDSYRKSAISAFEKLAKELGVPSKIGGLELSKDDLDFLSENVLKSCYFASNPKAASKKKIMDIYKELAE